MTPRLVWQAEKETLFSSGQQVSAARLRTRFDK